TFQDGHLARKIEGTKEGRWVHIAVAPERGPNSVLAQAWQIGLLTPPPEGFAATVNRGSQRLSPGVERVGTGDPEFGHNVFMKAPYPPAANEWLTPGRKQALFQLVQLGGLLYGGKVMFRKVGLETKAPVLLARFDALWGVAAALDRG